MNNLQIIQSEWNNTNRKREDYVKGKGEYSSTWQKKERCENNANKYKVSLYCEIVKYMQIYIYMHKEK